VGNYLAPSDRGLVIRIDAVAVFEAIVQHLDVERDRDLPEQARTLICRKTAGRAEFDVD
jgi:hypothetical protein